MNGWRDIDKVQVALAGDFDDEETTISIDIFEGEMGQADMILHSGGKGLAVSNLYSLIAEDPENYSRVFINIRFQLTWLFPEVWDTDGESHFIPKLQVEDLPCSLELDVPCNEVRVGMGNDLWSLDNDLRFDIGQGHMKAVELRNGIDHFNLEGVATLIGSGQALRFSGKVLFSEDTVSAPAGAFDIVLGDLEHQWRTSPRDGGYFTMDMLVPEVRSGHLDLMATMEGMPGLATDETETDVRLRLEVDHQKPVIEGLSIAGISDSSYIPLNSVSQARVALSTSDDHGFDLSNYPTLHYVIRAGASEVSRGSLPLSQGTDLDGEVFWSEDIDLTDAGATRILPTYTFDTWVTGSDASGNPFDANGNTESDPVASFGFTRTGPHLDLMAEDTTISWSDPSPAPGDVVSLEVHGFNSIPQIGDLRFTLERKVAGEWIEVSMRNTTVKGESEMHIVLQYAVPLDAEGTIEFRVREFDDLFELDRRSTSPLTIETDTQRDGDALANQVSGSGLSVILYLIALASTVFGIWMMVLYRESIRIDDDDILDQTSDVIADLGEQKDVPSLEPSAPPPPNMVAPPPPNMAAPLPSKESVPAQPLAQGQQGVAPVPSGGLPPGWTLDQWGHYGWTWLEQQGRA